MLKTLIALAMGASLSLNGLAALPRQGEPVRFAAPPAARLLLAERRITLKEAASEVQRREGGQILKAEPADISGRPAYRIRVVKGGRVKELMIDAESGRVVEPAK